MNNHAADADTSDLAEFGYEQQLRRRLGSYASFAAGFSFVSILTTVFQLFFIGFGFGGASFFWTWPIVFCGQLLVALCFAELSARYPISGCIYQWAKRLSNPTWGWFAGWTMLVAQIVTISAAAIALQVVLPTLWSGFELVSNPATNAVILGAILVTVTTIVSSIGVKFMSTINSIGVTCELIGVTLLVILLFTHAKRGPGAVFHSTGALPHSSYLGAFVVSSVMAAYVMVGFDSAGELSEETRDPRRTAPRAIIKALCASGLGGALLLLAAIFAAPSLVDGNLSSPTGGLPYVLQSTLGKTVGDLFLVDVAIAVCVCTLAIQTAATRMMFSMARDGVLPGSSVLRKVSPRTGTPFAPAIATGLGAIAFLLIDIGKASVFLALTSVCIVMLYGAYLMVTIPLLRKRLSGEFVAVEGAFSLGKWGVPVNIAAIVYGAAMMLNLFWPRASVYDPAGDGWYVHYFAPLFVGAAMLAGVIAFFVQKPKTVREPVAVGAQA